MIHPLTDHLPPMRDPAGCDPHLLRDLLSRMLLIRMLEERIVEHYAEQEMRTPVHLYLGQEAVAAGVCTALEAKDVIFSTHRNHGHYLAKGGDLGRLAAELYGKRTGCSGGKGGSMHVIDVAHGICGTTAIVGGSLPLAVGAALAFRQQEATRIAVAFFGDGAADEGVFHESLSFAALHALPVLFVLENNFYATCSPQTNRQPCLELHRLASSYGIPALRLDGNDVLAVYEQTRDAIRAVRAGQGPFLLECLTYRWKGHVGPECDVEKGFRPARELADWKARCPIEHFMQALKRLGILDEDAVAALRHEISGRIDRAFDFAKQSPVPGPAGLLENVW